MRFPIFHAVILLTMSSLASSLLYAAKGTPETVQSTDKNEKFKKLKDILNMMANKNLKKNILDGLGSASRDIGEIIDGLQEKLTQYAKSPPGIEDGAEITKKVQETTQSINAQTCFSNSSCKPEDLKKIGELLADLKTYLDLFEKNVEPIIPPEPQKTDTQVVTTEQKQEVQVQNQDQSQQQQQVKAEQIDQKQEVKAEKIEQKKEEQVQNPNQNPNPNPNQSQQQLQVQAEQKPVQSQDQQISEIKNAMQNVEQKVNAIEKKDAQQ